jgi:hypothetical protein
MDKMVNGKIVAMTPKEVADWTATSAAMKAQPPLENISKNLIWERMTEEEAEQADQVLRAQPAKIYRQYDGATYISTKADLYPMLQAAMTQLFGAERAAEILAPNF